MEFEVLRATEYNAIFNFEYPPQLEILEELQINGYKLLAYKGATGSNQIKSGLPTWSSESFIEMFGRIEIDHQPLYKVYVYEENDLDEYSLIEMQFQSDICPLGTIIQLNPDYSFSLISENGNKDSIKLIDNRPYDSKKITVGLASMIIGKFSPFCAFELCAQGEVIMKPNNKICLFTAQTDICRNQIVQNLTGMGCTFEFDEMHKQFNLKMTRMPWGISQDLPDKNFKLRFPNQPISSILNK